MKRSLFDISQDLLALEQRLDELEGDLSDPEVEEEIDGWFDRLEQDRDEKVDNYAALIQELDARATARKEEAKRLADAARRDEQKATYLKERLHGFFRRHGLDRIDTRRYSLRLARHGGKLPVVVDLDADDLPERFRRARFSADLTALREALEAGEELSFARFGDRGESLRIR